MLALVPGLGNSGSYLWPVNVNGRAAVAGYRVNVY